ncbi:KTSC domain-containing protein [Anabaena sp. UHCC 0187]|uniref:KTSC domain-containing protein n=1 Tax=Anabaena sp. UHCC 0187 TaxID=2590018 RepID=UPI0014483A4C|nr:KTSC domain-containing protein [Anabaena sp. UHCC 0187]MTJ13462.1 KTSC domain-containing protein [Anabaena sp. UHCC 0187]
MKLSKMDLSSLLAISHSEGYLQLLLDRGNEFELMQISAPVEAYEGLKQLNEVVSDTVPAEEEIPMLPVNSSVAYAIGYDADSQILQVEFQSGEVYQYFDVEAETWEDFHSADSIGEFFNQEIKGNYECDYIDNIYDDEDY